ncbi:MAG: hypothetical protein LBR76_05840, partial [Oscillospiraceae bacterium]|nr:hypothetical protein [Oscillospiraceae bacterium]
GGCLRFAPRLPSRWKRLRFSLTWQGRGLEVDMNREQTRFTLKQGEPMEALIYGKLCGIGAEGLNVPVM